VVVLGVLLAVPAAAGAHAVPGAQPVVPGGQGPIGPLNDLFALGQGEGQTPNKVAVQHPAEPPLEATPRAHCGPGAKPEPGIQGRIPAGSANDGLQCNISLVSHQGASGGFKVFRYVDTSGHTCAFYDTALLFPTNAFNFAGPSLGVAVLDMSNSAHPVQTDTLTEPPMLSPHESLNLNEKRGLLAAVDGNPSTYPGLVSIYDVHADCRHPVLQSTSLVARFGHESGFSPDGKTFYATGTALQAITAIDVSDPKAPHSIWQGNVLAHGMQVSDDGNRAYVADPTGGDMLILDTSEIQARKPDPQVREVSRLTWNSASIPQNAIPFTENGKPYVLEFDEYTAGTTGNGSKDAVGAARIVDISDDTRPHVVANLRLQVNQPADHAAAAGDPGADSPVQGYAAHYCNIPTRVDPKIVACSFIVSGLRLFDISDLNRPKEIGYFVAPTSPQPENGYAASDFAMSMPAFAPDQHEIWFSDGPTGFYAVRVADSVWPKGASGRSQPTTPARGCPRRRSVVTKVRVRRGARIRSVRAKLGGKRVRASRRGRTVRVRVNPKALPNRTVRLVVRIRLRNGRTVTKTRTFRPCR
jgi:hypothetical protein